MQLIDLPIGGVIAIGSIVLEEIGRVNRGAGAIVIIWTQGYYFK